MKKLGIALLLTVALAGCAGPSEPPVATSPAPAETVAPTPADPAPDPTPEPDPTETQAEQAEEIPDRADQSPRQREQMEVWYVDAARQIVDVGDATDAQLIESGDLICTALDKGMDYESAAKAPIPTMVSVGAADDAHFALGVAAIRSLCPEYEGAAD